MKNLNFSTKIYIQQDLAHEVNCIKDLIIQGEYAEAFRLAAQFKSEDDKLKIEELVLFTLDEVCDLLRIFPRVLFEDIQTEKIQEIIFLNDCQCYISLKSILEFLQIKK